MQSLVFEEVFCVRFQYAVYIESWILYIFIIAI